MKQTKRDDFPLLAKYCATLLAALFAVGCDATLRGRDLSFADAFIAPDARYPADSSSDSSSPADTVAAEADDDGDGLPNAFEMQAGDQALLDWLKADTDDDGTLDGEEDFDGDGLTVLDELAATRLTDLAPSLAPHPFRIDLLVELDSVSGRSLPAEALAEASRAYAAVARDGVSGQRGISLHVYADEAELAADDLSGNSALHNFFSTHGNGLSDGKIPPVPVNKMVHAILVTRRSDDPSTLAQTIVSGGTIDSSGVAIYYDALDDSHPACLGGLITLQRALAAALIHEIGHTLQLGHDTSVGGGKNIYNIMALATNCEEAEKRYFGVGNTDPTLGATEEIKESRFSDAAAALMRFNQKVSVETGSLVDTDGVEM